MSAEIAQQFASLDNCQPIQLHNYSGVYFLCQGTTIVYVGQSKNVANRITTHSMIRGKDFDTVMVMRVPEESLDSVEMHWIRQLQPKYNEIFGRPKKGSDVPSKIPRTVYLTAETSRRLDKAAAAEGVSNSIYIELTLKDRFKKEGIK